MTLLATLKRAVVDQARALPLARRAHALLRKRKYEQTVGRFIKDGTGRADPLPTGLVYEATMRCNLTCEFCYVGDLLNIEGEWREELPLDALRRAFPEGQLQVNLTGGEIFMRKDILSVLDVFREKGYTCGYLTTNGTIISDERADALAELARLGFLSHVSVSIDGPGELHDKARGVKGTFQRTSDGLRRLQAAAKKKGAPLRVSINTTVAEQSLDTLEQMVDVAEELGVDAIGLNHLMFATAAERDETLRMIGETDPKIISTYITEDPGVDPTRVREQVQRLQAGLRPQGRALRLPPQGPPAAHRSLLHPRHAARRPLPVPVHARPGVVQRQGVLLPVHPRRGRRPDDADARRGLERREIRRAAQDAARSRAVPRLPALLQGRAERAADAAGNQAGQGAAGAGAHRGARPGRTLTPDLCERCSSTRRR